MIRKLLVLFAVTTASALLASAAQAQDVDPRGNLVLAPAAADLVVSSNNADTFTVSNLLCSGGEICIGGAGVATASNFTVTVSRGRYTFWPWPGWIRSSTSYTVASLAPGASLPFPYLLSGLCGWVSVTVDSGNTVPERSEGNNTWGAALPGPVWC